MGLLLLQALLVKGMIGKNLKVKKKNKAEDPMDWDAKLPNPPVEPKAEKNEQVKY